jgi:hypothetical protein
VSDTSIEKRKSVAIKEKAQYAAALGIIGVMLWVAGFPVFLLFFVGVLTFFIWKVFSSEGRNETRRIFEFYLSANEILREDDRRWYGFEIQEAIARGEGIYKGMSAAPPLVSFALGALHQKLGDHSTAVKYLSQVVDDESVRESAIVYPSRELREYVRMLRKIERAPAEAPLTSSAIRALERMRRNRGAKLLEASRNELAKQPAVQDEEIKKLSSIVDIEGGEEWNDVDDLSSDRKDPAPMVFANHLEPLPAAGPERPKNERKTISEVLHDIYDGNVQ